MLGVPSNGHLNFVYKMCIEEDYTDVQTSVNNTLKDKLCNSLKQRP